jgi:hypothetical protein
MDWKQEYEQEYKRTSGKTAVIVERGGGWYSISTAHTWFAAKHRQSDILKMTEALKRRPDAA